MNFDKPTNLDKTSLFEKIRNTPENIKKFVFYSTLIGIGFGVDKISADNLSSKDLERELPSPDKTEEVVNVDINQKTLVTAECQMPAESGNFSYKDVDHIEKISFRSGQAKTSKIEVKNPGDIYEVDTYAADYNLVLPDGRRIPIHFM